MSEMQHIHNEFSIDTTRGACSQKIDNQPGEGARKKCMFWIAFSLVVVLAVGVGNWVWRTRLSATSRSAASASPSITRVLLPTGIGEGDIVSLGGATRAPETKAGRLESGGMRVE